MVFKVTLQEKLAILEFRNRGWSIREIAWKTGRSETTVKNVIRAAARIRNDTDSLGN